MTAATAEPVATLAPADVAFAERAARVAAFLARTVPGAPLTPYAALMVDLADRYGLDWRLLPVITVKESGAGIQACGFNATGYASCAVDFGSWEAGLETSAATLASYGGDSAWQACVWNMGPDGCRRGWAADYVAATLALMAGM